jgi:hypothetical protein
MGGLSIKVLGSVADSSAILPGPPGMVEFELEVAL